MANFVANKNISRAVLSPYHPRNIVRLRNLQMQMNTRQTINEERYSVFDNINDLEQDWRRIENDSHVSVHQSFAWCRAWITHKKVKPLFIVGYLEERLEFILPLEIRVKRGVTIAKLIGTDHSNFNFILCSKAFLATCGTDFTDRLEEGIKALKLPIDVIILDRMRAHFKDANNPFMGIRKTPNQNASFQLPLLDSFDETLSQINAKRKRKVFRKAVLCLDKAGGYVHTVAHSIAENERILKTFFEQKIKSLKSKGLPPVFDDPDLQGFWGELTRLSNVIAARLELHAIILNGPEHDGKILAILALTAKNDHVICQFSSFDEELNKVLNCSPGEFLFYLSIENINKRGFKVFDFGIGDQPYKRSWCRERSEHFDGAIAFNNIGRFYALMARFKTKLKHRIKSSKYLYSFVMRVSSYKLLRPAKSRDT